MTRITTLFLFILLISGCNKKDDFTFNTDLAIDSRFIILDAPADTTKIIVYSDHNWTAENDQNAPWITIQKNSGKGTAYAIVAVTANSSNYARASTIVFKAAGKTDTLKLGQRGVIIPTLAITAASVSPAAAGGTVSTAINTNLPLEMMSVSYTYDDSAANWITNLAIQSNNLIFNVAPNTDTTSRSGKIYLSYSDIIGTIVKDSLLVKQAKP